jgi:hypothetical protein
MPARRAPWIALMLLAALPALPAAADPPTPLGSAEFAFPGSITAPASARSAGLALADRWLGEDAFSNPAVTPGFRVGVSPAMRRVNRQDLRAENRNYDETAAYFDGAGVTMGLPAWGRFGAALYAFQPVLRMEQSAFSRGRGTPDPANPPAVIQTHASARELRAGLALSGRAGAGRVGVGVEWSRREDTYQRIEDSGDPQNAGTKQLEFSGDGLSFQVGAHLDRGDSSSGAFSVGAAARYLPALAVEGPHTEDLLTGALDETLHAERASGWELGTSARYLVTPAVRVLAAVGGRTAQPWEGLDLRAGAGWEWKLAWEYHDARDPWTLRFGLGQERQSGVPEARANVLGIGFGWRFSDSAVEVGVVRRTLTRVAEPNSFDDRVVVSILVPR